MLGFCTCAHQPSGTLDVNKALDYCAKQTQRTLTELKTDSGIDYTMMPRNIMADEQHWNCRKATKEEWCAGFWPGVLWYDYEYTKDKQVLEEAENFTHSLKFLSHIPAYDHDLGFLVFCSYGNGYRLTKNPAYKQVILDTADTLATLFNPIVGTILSWPREVEPRNWPHNTIMDNMINLEMLFWAAKNGGNPYLYDIAVSHADKTMKSQFRPDYTSYHVAVYDTITGNLIKGVTHQGYADSTMWARGQAWAIYGYTVVYRETKDPKYLDFAQKVTDVYLDRLPEDKVPYWDFDDPSIPNAPRDASAGAVVASALLELSTYLPNGTGKRYKDAAIEMLTSLSSDSYQSEAELEQEFIRLLCEQGYEYLPIHTEKDLIANLRKKLEELNNYRFSDTEWEDFFKNAVANPNEHIVEKTRKIQEDNVQVLTRDDGSSKNITLIDKKNIHNNRLQVINQYVIGTENGAKHDNRYDVTVLVNGLPLVHIELKRRGVAIREAFNQINRYQRDSFWAGCGLYEYIQIFVISNGTNTKYYSNSTRRNAEKEHEKRGASKTKTSNSFEFTCFWADANNRVIPDLIDFTKTFFARHTILNILTKYCIFTSEDMLMVMRPYQITATERILNRIEIANNYKKYGSVEGGGYIWHTTGSGKTLTSFKTARLASKLPYIDKVLFVVDRKDLDYQTMKEYDRFEKGAANSNTSTTILKRQLEDPDAHIIITTEQNSLVPRNPKTKSSTTAVAEDELR